MFYVGRHQWHGSKVARAAMRKIVSFLLLVMGTLIFAFPILWMLLTALKDSAEIVTIPPTFFPKVTHWENFSSALMAFPFVQYLCNSVFIAVLQVAGSICSASLVGYSFARLKWPGRDVWFIVLIATMMLPGAVTMVPSFIMFRDFGWMNSYLPLIVPTFCGNAFYIFLMRQFFRGVPMELSESARIDGCNEFGIFLRIILPLCKAALATVAIFAFMNSWNDYLGPLLYINSASRYTISYGLRSFQMEHDTDWNLLMAAALIISTPTVALFFFCQRYFIEGVTMTGLKG